MSHFTLRTFHRRPTVNHVRRLPTRPSSSVLSRENGRNFFSNPRAVNEHGTHATAVSPLSPPIENTTASGARGRPCVRAPYNNGRLARNRRDTNTNACESKASWRRLRAPRSRIPHASNHSRCSWDIRTCRTALAEGSGRTGTVGNPVTSVVAVENTRACARAAACPMLIRWKDCKPSGRWLNVETKKKNSKKQRGRITIDCVYLRSVNYAWAQHVIVVDGLVISGDWSSSPSLENRTPIFFVRSTSCARGARDFFSVFSISKTSVSALLLILAADLLCKFLYYYSSPRTRLLIILVNNPFRKNSAR